MKTGDVLGNGVFEFTPILSGLMGLDYHSSSIGIDFGSVAPGVKVIELVPDQNHTTHRINENAIALYVSSNNLNYTLIPRTDWEYQKDDKGVITLTLKEKLATRYLKLHVKYDERGRDFKPVNKATFLNEIAKMLRVYQEADSRTEEYQYDAAGNRKLLRVTLARTAEFESLYYTNSDRLKTDGKYAFVYDDAGNMIKKGNKYEISGDTVTFTKTSGEDVEYWEYQYDLLNRLIKVTKNGKIISEYAYDPEGFRVVKKAKGEITHYVFQGTEPIFEKNITTGKVKSFVYALGKHLARVDGKIGDSNAKKYWYVTDHLGSVRAVTDKDGKKVWSADYLAFGKQYTKDGDFEELHSFTGKEYDPDTGLHYYNARWYDADLGRFISEDPVGDPNNPNLYSYGANNPLRFRDPSGLSLEDTWAEQDAADAENTSYFTESELADMGYTGGSGSSDTGSSSPSTPTPDPSGDSDSGEGTKKTETGKQQSKETEAEKKSEENTKAIADDRIKDEIKVIDGIVFKDLPEQKTIIVNNVTITKVGDNTYRLDVGSYVSLTIGAIDGKFGFEYSISKDGNINLNVVSGSLATVEVSIHSADRNNSVAAKVECGKGALNFKLDGNEKAIALQAEVDALRVTLSTSFTIGDSKITASVHGETGAFGVEFKYDDGQLSFGNAKWGGGWGASFKVESKNK
ncbi:MAG: hypothetical protein GX075_11645 [Firmicutes bacterium]|nr:hypothetical protein [Bacillota bacterium]